MPRNSTPHTVSQPDEADPQPIDKSEEPKAIEEPLFRIATVLAPPKTFEIDGKPYTLYDVRHFDGNMESKYRVLVKQERSIMEKVDAAIERDDEADAQLWSSKVRDIRIKMISLCTDVPASVSSALDFYAQGMITQSVILAAGQSDDKPQPRLT